MKKIALIAFILVFTAGSAFAAAQWNLYGSARMTSFWEKQEAATGQLFAHGEDDYTDMDFNLQTNSRVGATVKFSDAVSGQFEFGIGTAVTNRIIIGHWNFGAGTLSVGQGYTPWYLPISSLAYGGDIGMLNTAEPYSGRQPMAQLRMGGFKLALVRQHGQANVTGIPAGLVKDVFPKIEVAYGQKIGPVAFDIAGGYQTFEIDTPGADYDIDAWAVGARAVYSMAPFRFAVVGRFQQNQGPWGQSRSGTPAAAAVVNGNTLTWDFGNPIIANNQVYDSETWGAGAVIGFAASKTLNFELGYARMESESDLVGQADKAVDQYYLQAAITLAPGVFIVPSIGVFDRRDDPGAGSQDGRKVTFAGAKWQINF